LDRPVAISVSTSRSRAVSSPMPRTRRGGLVRAANSAITRRVTAGDSSASPAATTWTALISSAASVSLTRKPAAPARSPSKMYSSSSKVVRMTTCTPSSPGWPAIRRVASMPSRPGIRMSISSTSGFSWTASRTAASPSATEPTTVMSSSASSSAAKPDLTSS
jgi:hypothetical protein